jgi:hypothetical protein
MSSKTYNSISKGNTLQNQPYCILEWDDMYLTVQQTTFRMNVLKIDFRNKDGGRSFLLELCKSQITRRHIWQNNNLHRHQRDYQKLIHQKVISFAYHS